MTSRRLPALTLAGALALSITGLAIGSPATAKPINSHCGTEAGGNSAGFVNHSQLTSALDKVERTSKGNVEVDVIGRSNEGRAIYSARVGTGDTVMLVQSQIHGNENHGTEALLNMLQQLGGNSPAAQATREGITIVAIPRLNVDGGEHQHRQNDQSWAQTVARFPQLAGAQPAWNYNANVPGFDTNRDFNPDLDYVPQASDFPGDSGSVGWYLTPEAQTVREVYRDLEQEFGTVDYFVDLHNQGPCYLVEGTNRLSTLSISGRFIADPAEHGTWPEFDYDASRRANVAIYDALKDRAGNGSGFGDVTLYPQDTDLPGTALGSFALRGSATVLFETSSQTQSTGLKGNGMLTKQVEIGLQGLIDAIVDGTVNSIDPNTYEAIPNRMPVPRS
ncbi:M14 family zinc carboxypeptidase [Nocardioides campestrisoli]|uniref:M14 family zinc carboxypeptidase n=1 Tax=Nocardioides campestrisoli TaxID=2736757 RepID=UPI00163DC763|nr:M14 family zinc carboxypeptidase [Nocardioides campestrisoli]